MNFIKGYKETQFQELQSRLNSAYKSSGKNIMELALAANVTTDQSVRFVLKNPTQNMSDKVLTMVANALDVNIFILWQNGEKHYFIKTKN